MTLRLGFHNISTSPPRKPESAVQYTCMAAVLWSPLGSCGSVLLPIFLLARSSPQVLNQPKTWGAYISPWRPGDWAGGRCGRNPGKARHLAQLKPPCQSVRRASSPSPGHPSPLLLGHHRGLSSPKKACGNTAWADMRVYPDGRRRRTHGRQKSRQIPSWTSTAAPCG